MSYKTTISVIMGVYNCAPFVDEAIKSIIRQTFTDWELIICDDYSTDGTYNIVAEYAKLDNRIKLLRNDTNRTLAPTLNKCLQKATGKYIARMDGDDTCRPNRLQEELFFLEKHPDFALVSTHMELFDSKGVYRTINYKEYPSSSDFLSGSQFCHAGCMIRKVVLDELGGYNTSNICKRVEDFDLWVRLYKAGYKGYNIQKVLYSMRDNLNAIKRRSLRNRINETAVMLRATKAFSLGFRGYVRAIIPILKFLVPTYIYKYFHRKNK